jgi:hypothetical protein
MGSVPATNVVVRLVAENEVLATRTVPFVPEVRDYSLGKVELEFRDVPMGRPFSLVVDPEDLIPEITEINNRAELGRIPRVGDVQTGRRPVIGYKDIPFIHMGEE